MRSRFLSVFPLSFSFAALAALSVAACGSTTGSPGSGSVSGTTPSTTFTVASAFAFFQGVGGNTSTSCTGSADGGTGNCKTTTTPAKGQLVGIVLTNRADVSCSTLASAASASGLALKSADALLLAVANQDGDVAPGTYPIVTTGNPTTGSESEYFTTTATCESSIDAQATSGTVTLTAVSAGGATGTFDVTFPGTGTISGSFDTSTCDLPDGGLFGASSTVTVTTGTTDGGFGKVTTPDAGQKVCE